MNTFKKKSLYLAVAGVSRITSAGRPGRARRKAWGESTDAARAHARSERREAWMIPMADWPKVRETRKWLSRPTVRWKRSSGLPGPDKTGTTCRPAAAQA